MKRTISHFSRLVLCLAALSGYTVAISGCGGETTAPVESADEHDHDDHDHEGDDHDHDGHDHDAHDHDGEGHGEDAHAGHDHPAHGPNGGHMANLSGGAHAEWAHDDQKNEIVVYPESAESVTEVTMTATIDGQATPYAFEKGEIDGKTIFKIVSPELLTAIKMGDAVETELVIKTDEGEQKGKVLHHAH